MEGSSKHTPVEQYICLVSRHHFNFTEEQTFTLEMGQKPSPTDEELTEIRGKLKYSEHVGTHEVRFWIWGSC